MPESPDARRRKWQLAMNVRVNVRELSLQLSKIDQQVGRRLEMRAVDMECLDIISRHGPMGASALARSASLHPATLTGVLDRLEKSDWIVRERDSNDRRAVVVRAERERSGRFYELYRGMNRSMEDLLTAYDESELALISDFLERARDACVVATEELAQD